MYACLAALQGSFYCVPFLCQHSLHIKLVWQVDVINASLLLLLLSLSLLQVQQVSLSDFTALQSRVEAATAATAAAGKELAAIKVCGPPADITQQ
jgi:hypothetical protein